MDYQREGHHHHHRREGNEFQEGYVQGERGGQGGFQQGGCQQGGGFQQGGGYQQGGGIQQGGYQQGNPQSGMGGQYGGQRREFYIVSEMNNKVVDIEGANSGEGVKIITYDKNSNQQRNQLWYMDSQGFIRSALNDMSFSNGERGHHLKTTSAGMGDPRAQWRLQGNKIVNQAGETLDIAGRHSRDGAEIISYQDDGGSNQHWRLDYIN